MINQSLPIDWQLFEKERWALVADRIAEWKQAGKRIVLVTGVFDVFHEEHRAFLQKASEVGDVLVVGVESDVRVKEMKGPDRPLFSQQHRFTQVSLYPVVDIAAILPESFSRPEHHRSLIQLIQPHILAVSAHSPHQDKKQLILQEFGGTLRVVHEHNPAVSTTKLLAQRT